jgi:hypothetical protein
MPRAGRLASRQEFAETAASLMQSRLGSPRRASEDFRNLSVFAAIEVIEYEGSF